MKSRYPRVVLTAILFGLPLLPSNAPALVQSGALMVVSGLTDAIKEYSLRHGNQLPTSWQELDKFSPLSVLGPTEGPGPISDQYVLLPNAPVSQELNDEEVKNAQVLVIGRAPMTDPYEIGIGRYVIYRSQNGDYFDDWIPEEKIQKIIVETYAVVPPPPAPQPVNSSSNPVTNAPSNLPQANEETPPSQPAPPPPAPPPVATAVMPQTPPIAGLPLWIYAIIVLTLLLLGGLWYRFRSKE
jgi:hypothetical protein